MATKHEQLLTYIEQLPVGEKLSVRRIAKELQVSEGTAYRAIKEAEMQGYLSTMERIGTIRIEKKEKENFERLTFAEVVKVTDGVVLGGRAGLHKTLTKFVIGAMKVEDMMKYTTAGNLLIVGNRTRAHEAALKAGAAVLITGGFDTEERVRVIADELELPILSTSYDSFTVATMIHRAIYDQMIKKEIVMVEDMYTPLSSTVYLEAEDTVASWYEQNERSRHSRFPVIDNTQKVLGMVTAKDVIGKESSARIGKIMSKHPSTVTLQTSVATAAHKMIWEGIEQLPVVNEAGQLKGIISRQDVLKALQMIQRQPQVAETIEDLVTSRMEGMAGTDVYTCEVTPQMASAIGTVSYGVFTIIVTEATNRALRGLKRGDHVVETMTIYFLKPVQIDQLLTITPHVLDIGRNFGKVDVEVFSEGEAIGRALLVCQFIDQ
ncbi:DRTGG domain-containing protein [Bacillus fonticola]|uniref:DRTGG domain-containing protein n=1 Tax=Bacillus fonticola TaxID=2728853 RepID=UPI0014765635|nr:DRTGG domain-containing protein [Bacillus fonticola]